MSLLESFSPIYFSSKEGLNLYNFLKHEVATKSYNTSPSAVVNQNFRGAFNCIKEQTRTVWIQSVFSLKSVHIKHGCMAFSSTHIPIKGSGQRNLLLTTLSNEN